MAGDQDGRGGSRNKKGLVCTSVYVLMFNPGQGGMSVKYFELR